MKFKCVVGAAGLTTGAEYTGTVIGNSVRVNMNDVGDIGYFYSEDLFDELEADGDTTAHPLLPTDKQVRKDTPIARGVLDYFPLALAEIARVSKAGNDQHNPGQPLHWAKEKSTDHADCIARHLIERGAVDDDGMRHSAKMAWRALALLQLELEAER